MIVNLGDYLVASMCMPCHSILGNIHLGEVFVCVGLKEAGETVLVRRVRKKKPVGLAGEVCLKGLRRYVRKKLR